ncbi:MAG TPA: response regulator transcription factor [Ktedonobacteraceae bacterium]|nr:response regulator transcription factor [Ktedonobacteraceae bacterium]
MRYSDAGDTLYAIVATEPVSSSSENSVANQIVYEATGLVNGSGARTTRVQATRTIRVLIVDDHTLIREGLRQLFTLEDDIEVVGEATDGIEVIPRIRQLHPDVVLMDIHMPLQDGITATRQISKEFPTIAVIMLTMHRQNQQVIEAFKSGARGYLLKSASAREVAQAIRKVGAGEIAIPPELMGAIVNEVRRGSGVPCTPDTVAGAGGPDVSALTEKEIEIIRYLATGMSNKEIAEKLAYSEKTVKNYLSVIYQKLHLRDRTQVAIFALRHGLLPDEEFVI